MKTKKNPAHRWKGHKQSLIDRLVSHPDAKYRLSYSDPQYEKKRKTLLLMRGKGLVKLEFNFPKNDDVYYQATSKLLEKSARKNPSRGLWAIYAKSGSVRTHYTGKKFTVSGKARKFSSQTAAYSCALDLVNKYPALKQTRLTVEKLRAPKF